MFTSAPGSGRIPLPSQDSSIRSGSRRNQGLPPPPQAVVVMWVLALLLFLSNPHHICVQPWTSLNLSCISHAPTTPHQTTSPAGQEPPSSPLPTHTAAAASLKAHPATQSVTFLNLSVFFAPSFKARLVPPAARSSASLCQSWCARCATNRAPTAGRPTRAPLPIRAKTCCQMITRRKTGSTQAHNLMCHPLCCKAANTDTCMNPAP